CRKICQRKTDCGVNEDCLNALFNPMDTGGVDENRLTSACYPSTGLRAEGEPCIDNSDPMNPQFSQAVCSSGVCDFLEYFFRRDALGQANAQPLCSRMCVNHSDCPSGKLCLLANHIYGLTNGQATPVRFPDVGSRSYYDAVRGCFSAVTDTSTGGWSRLSTGSLALGSPCVRTSTVQFLGTSECSSGPCLSVAERSASLTEGYCSKSCVRDSECDNPSTPGWVCSNAFGQLSSPMLKQFSGAFFSVFDRYYGGFLCVPPR
ncbi:MAG: hypothetical protein VYC39_18285, partial [Myxococcota bacterium]|nr:hypothetical protein [Myxococcota bacterium]